MPWSRGASFPRERGARGAAGVPGAAARCLTARGDALFDLADAVLCSGGPVRFSFEFADEQGGPLHPADVTYAFHMIAYLAGLPPVRLHDLRHGAATLLLAAGHDMKVVQETLGLSSITIAGDT
jgi:integrase